MESPLFASQIDELERIERELLQRTYRYVRVSYDEKPIRFGSSGAIDLGATWKEAFWKLSKDKKGIRLSILDKENNLICIVWRRKDGVWEGGWVCSERMEVLLIPDRPRTLFVQQASGKHRRMLDLTAAHHAEYCRRHNIDYWLLSGEIQFNRPPVWSKILVLRRALRAGFDFIAWVDADAVIVDCEVDLRDSLVEFNCIGMCHHSSGWRDFDWHFNAGVIFLKNSREVRRFLTDVWRAGPVSGWEEQERMMELYLKYPHLVQKIDNRWNAHPSSPSCDPVIKAWHGFPGDRCHPIKQELARIYGNRGG